MRDQTNTRHGPHQRGEVKVGALAVDKLTAIYLAWSPTGIVRLGFDDTVISIDGAEQAEVPQPYAEKLKQYFAGEEVEPVDLPVDLSGTPFQLRVWEALRRIPRGSVRTYAGIASDVGSPRAMRAVGMANAANPVAIVVPCHRVVEVRLRIGGYSAGLDRKRVLLELEGVRVEGDRVLPGQLDLLI